MTRTQAIVFDSEPSSEIYLTIASHLAPHPSPCLVMEDSLMGIFSAKACKMLRFRPDSNLPSQ